MSRKRIGRELSLRIAILATGISVVLLLTIIVFFTTYTSFRQEMDKSVMSQVKKRSDQIVYHYESFIDAIIETSNAVQIYINSRDIWDDSEELGNYFRGVTELRSEILSISVYDNDSLRCVASSSPIEVGTFAERVDPWFAQANAEDTVHAFSFPYAADESGKTITTISKRILFGKGKKPTTLKMEISFENFVDLAQKSNFGEGGHIDIIDPEYNIVYSSDDDHQLSEEVPIYRQIMLGSGRAVINGRTMSVNIETLLNTRWRICVAINIDSLNAIERSFLQRLLFATVVAVIVAIFVFQQVTKKITDPLKQLEKAMRRIEQSDYFVKEEVHLPSGKEVASLAKSFNAMMRKLQELMDRVVYEQNQQRKSELKALQNQINPHFLYNTLDSIVWMIENNKREEASAMVVALAKLFRISISKGGSVITVREELEHVKSYLFIQSIRYNNSFEYEFDVDPKVLEMKTLNILLQPLVENAIYHGLKNHIDHGRIVVSARLDERDRLVLSVFDNGYGIKESKIEDIYAELRDLKPQESVGLKNVYLRLKIYYGEAADLRIESELDEGTTITLIIPPTAEHQGKGERL
ncbi:MAG: sensor histidine kinase [Bacillota bacterium]|nr:sensor histidine kinase [Bacillota bacterium]